MPSCQQGPPFGRMAPQPVPISSTFRAASAYRKSSIFSALYLLKGTRVSIGRDAQVDGILYAPNADHFVFDCASTTTQPVVTGQVLAGPGGIAIHGYPVTVQLDCDYVDAFNSVAGQKVTVEMHPGTWTSLLAE